MKSQPLWLSAFAVCGAMFMSVGSGCKDDGEVNNEAPLPGVGPIGLGGSSSTGGAGGTAGTAGTAGMAGTGGAGAGGTGGAGAGGAGAGGAGAGGAGAGGATGGSGGGMAVCPTFGGDAKARFANLVPAATALDFCVKGPGKADFEGPVFKCASSGSATLAYKQISKALSLAAGSYEIRSVTGTDCSAVHASATVTLSANDTFSVVAFGGGATGETAKVGAFKNDPGPTDGSVNLRFIHGIHKAFPVDVGLAADGKLPTIITLPVFTNVAFGAIAAKDPAGTFPIDEQGYATKAAVLTTPVCATKSGDPNAIFAATVAIEPANTSLTAYGVGIQGDATFPAAAVVCNDGKDDAMYNSCVTPLGGSQRPRTPERQAPRKATSTHGRGVRPPLAPRRHRQVPLTPPGAGRRPSSTASACGRQMTAAPSRRHDRGGAPASTWRCSSSWSARVAIATRPPPSPGRRDAIVRAATSRRPGTMVEERPGVRTEHDRLAKQILSATLESRPATSERASASCMRCTRSC